ncbi:homeobox-leucine zipper protein ROC8-like [Zingiber officinale]|uniref:homeobox-leucine zipper protein ROC8-like n=1 Tax=Zingiber officinale TaxID=94328 RepID=UPI001C4C9B2E|nr:homeobox-leucine zipper protein ROC8-like [Zingiber officinale]
MPVVELRRSTVIPTPEAKQSMMKLAQRMVKSFCATFSGSIANKWIMMPGSNDAYQVYFHKTDTPRLAGGEMVSAATSVWLPLHPERLFSFLKDEQNRNLVAFTCYSWEVSKEEVKFQRVAHFINGSNSGNSISILNRSKSTSSLLILQESCTDASGSLLVYSPLGLPSLDMVRRGEDASSVQLIVSGFTIVPDDGFAGAVAGGGPLTSSSSPAGGVSGSLLTVGFQTVMNKTEGAEIGREAVASINLWISNTIEKIKAALLYH